MEYKVCILAAGKGTRLTNAKNFNKALVPVGEKSALSHIIDKFPKNTEIIIAVGYNSHLIKEFVRIAYPHRKITLIEVDNFDKPGSGPGYSLYSCRKNLQCPFIFTSVDTIVLENIPEPNKNWIGVAKTDNPETYCMVDIRDGLVKGFYNKMPMVELLKYCSNLENLLNSAFIGMAGVYNYSAFWDSFNKEHRLVQGEVQVMDGLEGLMEKQLLPQQFTWFDTGNDAGYYFTNKHFSKLGLLVKPDEFIYFENNLVIKYFANQKIFSDRVRRATILKGIIPKIVYANNNFYAYRFVPGMLLSQVDDVAVFRKFLKFCQCKIWKPLNLNLEDQKSFNHASRAFYFEKTKKRIEMFYQKTDIQDCAEKINGVLVPKLDILLNQVKWDSLTNGIPVLFHGDLQPENVVVVKGERFKLIDWRQNYEGIVDYGDIYYDFAKLYHALIISNEVVRKGGFDVKRGLAGEIQLNYLIKNNLWEFKACFERFLVENNYDLAKVRLLSGLIFINIAPLYNYPYNTFLYYLGKLTLYQQIYDRKI